MELREEGWGAKSHPCCPPKSTPTLPQRHAGQRKHRECRVPCAGGTLAGTLSQHRTRGWARGGSWHRSRCRPPRSHRSERTWHTWTSPLGPERAHTHSRLLGELHFQTPFWFLSGFSCISQNFLSLENSELGFLSLGVGAAGREYHSGHPTSLSSVVEFGQLKGGHGHPCQGLPPKPTHD